MQEDDILTQSVIHVLYVSKFILLIYVHCLHIHLVTYNPMLIYTVNICDMLVHTYVRT